MFLRLTGGESSMGVGGYRCLLLFVTRPCRSLITMSAISLGRVLACHPILSSAAKTTWRQFVTLVCHTCAKVRKTPARLPGMPFPLMVLAMMAVGWWRGWLRALQSSSTLCPSTTMACQLQMWGRVWLTYSLHKLTIPQFSATYIVFTQKLHSVSDISPRGAAEGRSHTAPDGWCPWWPPGCQAGNRRQTTRPPRPRPQTFHHPPPGSRHDNWGGQQSAMRAGCRAAKSHFNVLRQFSIQTRFTQCDSWAGSQMWHDERSQRLFQGGGPEFQTCLVKEIFIHFFFNFAMYESDICLRERKRELQ